MQAGLQQIEIEALISVLFRKAEHVLLLACWLYDFSNSELAKGTADGRKYEWLDSEHLEEIKMLQAVVKCYEACC